MLGQLNGVIRDVRADYERFEFYRVYQRIYQFCSVELSSFYLDMLKDRLYAELPTGPERRAAQFVLARLHDHLTRLLAPIIPHTAEESWEYRPRRATKPSSVHLRSFPSLTRGGTTPSERPAGTSCSQLREQVLRSRWRACGRASKSAAPRKPGSGSPPIDPSSLCAERRIARNHLQHLGSRSCGRPSGRGSRVRHRRAIALRQMRAMLELPSDRRAKCPHTRRLCDRCVRECIRGGIARPRAPDLSKVHPLERVHLLRVMPMRAHPVWCRNGNL